jgi:gliding motility-associated-like protein
VGDYTTVWVDSIGGAGYQWYFEGTPLNGAVSHSFTTPAGGYYYVSVTTACGTFNTDSVEVIVKSVENASISNNQIICPPEMVELHVYGGVSYQWTPATFLSNPSSPNPIASPNATTIYTVEITNEWGCKMELTVEVAVACDTLLIPTGFSPNSDGTNDGYVIDHIDKYPGNKLWVYNRWGNLVYKAKDYDNSWNGIANVSGVFMGKKVPAGTYFYILDLNDNSKPHAGYLIIRY